MKKFKTLKQSFGINGYGLIDFPKKISGIQISRLKYGNEMGCSYCFPHGFETANSHQENSQRNWKKYRNTRWKNTKQVP
ncbi:phosphate ABC transporter substrate-binding protein [Chryseobacterium sp. OSA05B]|uniref:phosphate ABC transporter substrate-binding protein n=1 Tax=Chryseobacterium sp. OSA05B TaxID=2862650 RepID=UPI001CBB7B7A|nr:phosphate ABC transporter substrate-binding protein [Chryseobacterium sp. OSA05B]